MSPHRTRLALVTTLLALVLPVGAQEKARPEAAREGIEAVEAQLARAVDRVSLPHAARLLGRAESARGYRLPGYGLVLVLTPRMLPGGEGQVFVLRGGAPKHRVHVESRRPSTGEAEWTVGRRADPDLRAAGARAPARDRGRPPCGGGGHGATGRGRAGARGPATRPPAGAGSAGAPVTPEAPPPPSPPPWKFWFETGTPEEKRTPEAVVADVRGAVIDALAAQGGRLVGLAGDERVTVAVDFVPGGIFAAQARPGKTLVVSVRVKDVDARARGAITPEELRRRVEVTEY